MAKADGSGPGADAYYQTDEDLSMIADTVNSTTTEIANLCQRFGVRRLDLFGSGVRGDFDRDGSDLDFLGEFIPLSPKEHADSYFGLRSSLAYLLGREIDLVEWEGVGNLQSGAISKFRS